MRPTKPILAGAALLLGATLVAHAQQPYPPYPYYPQPYAHGQVPASLAAPPSWSYDPYTSGLGPCPQRYPTDPPCRYTMSPTYGQPSYWSTR